jgi:hypothetical protein
MDYHVETKALVDKVFLLISGEMIEMIGADSYDEMDIAPDTILRFNCTIPLTALNDKAILNLVAYGKAGGVAEYNILSILSKPPDSNKNQTIPGIINTEHDILQTMLEFPFALMELLNLPKYIPAVLLEIDGLRKKNSWSNDDLLARGIDPLRKNWVSVLALTLPEWALDRMDHFIETVLKQQSPQVIVHCYSSARLLPITIKPQK